MRTFRYLVAMMMLCAAVPGTSWSLEYDLSTESLAKAMQYGKKGKSRGLDSFRSEWFRRVGVHRNTVQFMLAAPFLEVAAVCREAATKYQECAPDYAETVGKNASTRFSFSATFIANSPSQASDFVGVVKVGDRIVQPTNSGRPDCDRIPEGLLCSIDYYFDRSDVPGDAKIKVVLVRGSIGGEVSAGFDLKKVR
jgi:hypothetical protein